ncbi:hypothetical protein DFO67_1041, partial [Modicisalibacter xianhensis]
MTVPTSDNREQYEGNGTATTFDYAFRIFKAEDLTVIKTDAQGNELTLVLGTHYSVSGAGNDNGGTVTYPLSGDPLATGETLTILRVIAITQETDLRNQGAYYPETIEDEMDRGRMVDQQQQEEINRSLKKSEGGQHYDAQGNRIMNVGYPADNQDVMSKEAVSDYFKGLESGELGDTSRVKATGTEDERALADWMMSLAYPTTSTGTQTLSNALDRRAVYVDSIVDLLALDAGKLTNGQVIAVRGYRATSTTPVGLVEYDAARPKSDHNGYDVFSPTVPWDGLDSSLSDYFAGAGETDVGGTGVYVALERRGTVRISYIFDDGYTEHSTDLAPEFEQRGVRAGFAINPVYVNQAGRLTGTDLL